MVAKKHLRLPRHGAKKLADVRVDSYGAELRQGKKMLGDGASRRAFERMLESWRAALRRVDADPLGDVPTRKLGRKTLSRIVTSDEVEPAALIHSAIEDFAQALAQVIRRFLRVKAWRKTERIVVGGGFSGGRVGHLAIARSDILLKADGIAVELVPVTHDPDKAGLIGAIHLLPRAVLDGYDALLAVDVGGTNIRVGVVEFARGKDDALAGKVAKVALWRHRDDEPKRDEAAARLVGMLADAAARAVRRKRKLAPVIVIGCPGVVLGSGAIERGSQNLPGNWESRHFNLPAFVAAGIPKIDGRKSHVVMHNDAVVQGLSEWPRMRGATRWGVLTIGTGLGNARFTNRRR